MSFHPFDLYQFCTVTMMLAGNSLVLGTQALWAVRVNTATSMQNMWIMIGISLGVGLLSCLLAIVLQRRSMQVWKWTSWILTTTVAAVATVTVYLYGLFALGPVTALIVVSSILGIACLVAFSVNLAAEFKILETKSGVTIASIIQFVYSALTLALGIAMLVDVQTKLTRLCPANPICSVLTIVKWIAVGSSAAVIVISMIWAFVAGFIQASKQDAQLLLETSKTSTTIAGTYLDQEAPLRVDTLPIRATLPQQMESIAPAAPLPAPTVFVPQTIVATIPDGPPPIRQASFRASTLPIQPSSPTLQPTMNRYRVVRSYRAAEADELTIMPGEVVVSLAEYADGWIFARRAGAQTCGVVPIICLKSIL